MRRNSSFDSVPLRVNSDRLLITASLPGDPAICARHMRPKRKEFAHQLDRPLRNPQAAAGGNGQGGADLAVAQGNFGLLSDIASMESTCRRGGKPNADRVQDQRSCDGLKALTLMR